MKITVLLINNNTENQTSTAGLHSIVDIVSQQLQDGPLTLTVNKQTGSQQRGGLPGCEGNWALWTGTDLARLLLRLEPPGKEKAGTEALQGCWSGLCPIQISENWLCYCFDINCLLIRRKWVCLIKKKKGQLIELKL